jgi:hypothetical protein
MRENERSVCLRHAAPGHSNAHILENIGGEWLAGFVSGTFYERGWGAAADFPGLSST